MVRCRARLLRHKRQTYGGGSVMQTSKCFRFSNQIQVQNVIQLLKPHLEVVRNTCMYGVSALMRPDNTEEPPTRLSINRRAKTRAFNVTVVSL